MESLFYFSSQGIGKWFSIKCLKEMVLLMGITYSQPGHTISYQRTLNGLICLIGLSLLCSSEKKLRTTSTALELMHKPSRLMAGMLFLTTYCNHILCFIYCKTKRQSHFCSIKMASQLHNSIIKNPSKQTALLTGI